MTAASDWVKSHPTQATQTGGEKPADLYPSKTEPGTAPVPVREETLKQATADLAGTVGQVQAQLSTIDLPLGWFCAASEHDSNQSAASAEFSQQESKHAADTEKTNTVEAPAKCVRGQVPVGGLGWLVKIFGLLITTLAISQGSPFWFDVLQKLVNVRLAGNAPDGKKKTK